MLAFGRADLSTLVEVIWRAGTLFELPRDRIRDLMYAASEVVMNTVPHGGGEGELRLWQDHEHLGLVCEFRDRCSDAGAWTNDPWTESAHADADRGTPAAGKLGRWLWLVDQHCDLAEVRSDGSGTTVRLHVRP
jgi:hypothetical protein